MPLRTGNHYILIFPPLAMFQRQQHSLQNSAKVAAHMRNIQFIHSDLRDWLPIQIHYGSSNKARDSISQRLQGSHQGRVVSFLRTRRTQCACMLASGPLSCCPFSARASLVLLACARLCSGPLGVGVCAGGCHSGEPVRRLPMSPLFVIVFCGPVACLRGNWSVVFAWGGGVVGCHTAGGLGAVMLVL